MKLFEVFDGMHKFKLGEVRAPSSDLARQVAARRWILRKIGVLRERKRGYDRWCEFAQYNPTVDL